MHGNIDNRTHNHKLNARCLGMLAFLLTWAWMGIAGNRICRVSALAVQPAVLSWWIVANASTGLDAAGARAGASTHAPMTPAPID